MNQHIEINIEDESLFAAVALVVDQDDFATEIQEVRNKYKHLFKKASLLSLKGYYNFKRSIFRTDKERAFNQLIDQVRRNLRLPVTYKKVIQKSAFCGAIENDDFLPAYFEEEWLGMFDGKGEEPDIMYRIVISPQARDKDVIKALQEYRDQLGNKKGVAEYRYIPEARKIEQGKPSIKHHRDWYLKDKSGIPVDDIALEYGNKCPIPRPHQTGKNKPKGCICFDESTIRYGIRNYKKLLWKSRTS